MTASATISPCDSSRFARIRLSSTTSPSSMNFACAREPAVRMKLSGIAIHSTCHGPVARSKSGTMASSMSAACCRTAFALASRISDEIGLRFCGMVEEAPR